MYFRQRSQVTSWGALVVQARWRGMPQAARAAFQTGR